MAIKGLTLHILLVIVFYNNYCSVTAQGVTDCTLPWISLSDKNLQNLTTVNLVNVVYLYMLTSVSKLNDCDESNKTFRYNDLSGRVECCYSRHSYFMIFVCFTFITVTILTVSITLYCMCSSCYSIFKRRKNGNFTGSNTPLIPNEFRL